MEIEQVEEKKVESENDGSLNLPLARVKKIIKSDPDCKSVSGDACFLIAKATVF